MLVGMIGVVALRLGVDDAGGDVIIYQCWKSCLFVAAGNVEEFLKLIEEI